MKAERASDLKTWAIALVALAAVVGSSVGCGYALAGRGNTLPAYVKTIGVPQIVNQSSTPNIDRVLTDAVRSEFQGRGRYLVEPDAAGTDAVLTATITSVALRPVSFTIDRQATVTEVVVTVNAEFKDLHDNKIIWSSPSLQVRDEYRNTTSSVANDPTALFSQDSSALDRLAKEFAKKVVAEIFQAF
ncbi:MAG: LPS assembly lipoprotein LptE [Acidobacteriota bacterium]